MSVLDQFPPGEYVLSMASHNGIVYVATNRKVYFVGGSALFPLKIESIAEPPSQELSGGQPDLGETQVEPGPVTFDPHANSVLMQDDKFREAIGEMRSANGL